MTRRVRARIDARIHLWAKDLTEDEAHAIKKSCTYANADRFKAQRAGRFFRHLPETIDTHAEHGGWLSVPRGALAKVRRAIRSGDLDGARLAVDDRRVSPGTIGAPRTTFRMQLRDYQERMVDDVVASENCLAIAPTGGGKTSVILACVDRVAREHGASSLVMVWTRGLAVQWAERAMGELHLNRSDVGFVGDGRCDVRPLTIAMNQTLAKMGPERLDAFASQFGAFFYDEVQRAAAATIFRVVDRIPARWRVGASASEKRKDRKEFLIRDLFGEVGASATDEEVLATGATVPVRMVVYDTDFAAPWYEDERDFVRLLDEMCADEERTRVGVDLAVAAHARGGTAVVLTPRVAHAHEVASALRSHRVDVGMLLGGADNAREFDAVVDRMKRGKTRLAVGTVEAFGTGLDVPSLTDVVLLRPLATNRPLLNQVRGRACRAAPGKTHATLHYVHDPKVFPEEHRANLAAWFGAVSTSAR